MSSGPLVTFLDGTSEIRFFFPTQFADPHIDDVPGFAVHMWGNGDGASVYNEFFFRVVQWALKAQD